MTHEARHSPDTLDQVRMNADKVHAMLTDYRAGIEPSALYKLIYLNEASKVMALSAHAATELRLLREWMADACGIDLTARNE